MNLTATEILQYAAWALALIEFVLALYVLLLNIRHTANRHVCGLLLLLAANTAAVAFVLPGTPGRASQADSLAWPLLAATIPAFQSAFLITAVVLLKPGWVRGRWRAVWWLVYALIALPFVLTAIDLALGTNLWYTGLGPEVGASADGAGFEPLQVFTQGTLGPALRILHIQLMGIPLLLFLLYVALRDKEATRLTRRLAWLLLGAEVVGSGLQFGLRGVVDQAVVAIVSTFLFVLAYAYAIFQQMISERRAQTGRLQTRLTALILVVAVPVLVAVVLFSSLQTNRVLEQKANEQLEAAVRALAANLEVWLNLNLQSLQTLATLPDITSMEMERQKPILEAMAAAHPHMYLVSTTDMKGMNVARNDDEAPKDYHDRLWHIGARNGAPVTYQTLVGRTSGEPALVISVPIRRTLGTIVGVAMFASDLDDIGREVQATKVGETGFAYIVDGLNQVVAHPIPEYAAEFRDLDYYPPVFEMRAGKTGPLTFVDEGGVAWRASMTTLDNGWGVIVQQEEEELLATVRSMREVAWGVVSVGGLLLVGLTLLVVRQIIQPIQSLTETATAIAAGDLDREAVVESEDEVGALARAFNSMTRQLRGLIGGLEEQVTERTHQLAQRSAYLEATAEVGHAAASILDRQQLVQQLVELIRERFGLYYVGLFLSDDAATPATVAAATVAAAGADDEGQWVVLEAGTGEAGKKMLARGHRIRVGEGMVGWSVAQGKWRVAAEAEMDDPSWGVRLATPELPETRSEAALPLRSRGRTLGALTVQHTEPGAFDPDTMTVLQTMADQVAVALDNARLFAESQEALEMTRRAYGEASRQAWGELIRSRAQRSRAEWGYRYVQGRVVPMEAAATVAGAATPSETRLDIPLQVRDEVIGGLGFRKRGSGDAQPEAAWTQEEIELLETLVSRLADALESARLYQDTQRRAARERLLGDVGSRVRESLDMDTVLRTALLEISRSLDLAEVEVRMSTEQMRRVVSK
ncbi:MAG: GAF domain-containing protein [Anaerolineae bacterium]|nr:GAF domain-containing protein [Anaerolineae bacterium]